jgi:ATP-dependent helicase/nuclease subunit A
MTRAEDRLYICGWNGKRAAPGDCWYRLIERAFAQDGPNASPAGDWADAIDFDFTAEIDGGWAGPGWRLASSQGGPIEAREQRLCETSRAGSLPDWARRAAPSEPAPPRPLAPSRRSEPELAVRSPFGPDEGQRFRRGRLIHRLLQSLPDLPPADREAAGRRFLAAAIHGLAPDAQAEILQEVLAVLEAPALAGLFGPDSRAEVPLTGLLARDGGEEVVSGQIDRLLVEQERVIIVDYKSNRPAPRYETEVPPLYLRQMAAYRAILMQIYPDRRLNSYLLWTDGPRLMQLSDANLASYAP